MSRTNPVTLIVTIAALIAVLGGLSLARGGLYMDRYEGDVLHLIEIILRTAEGQRPHLDFMTPIGVLATWPIAIFVKAGLGIGMAIHAAQITVALVLAVPLVWSAYTRFAPGFAQLFAVFCMVLVLALVHGDADPHVSMSMHYNRWAWAFVFVALSVAFLPTRGEDTPVVDGALIGVCMAIVVLIKVTYVVALAPAIIVALLARGAGKTLVVALVAGIVTLGLFTPIFGWEFWPAYADDLITTATSEVRSFPSKALNQVITAPMFLGAHLLALLAVMILRQGRQAAAGLSLLILLPGFVYITYQNFGNDPQWAVWLGLVLFMVRPLAGVTNGWGWDLRQAATIVATGLLVFGAPTFLNMAYSPIRHFADDTSVFVRFFPRSTQHDDLFFPENRTLQVDQILYGERPGAGMEQMAGVTKRDAPTVLNGETLAYCTVQNGMLSWFDIMAQELEQAGYANGTQIMTADLLSALPLFSDGIDFVRGDAPWRYSGIPGIESAQYVLVPLCPIIPKVRALVLKELEQRQTPLTEVYRSPLFILLEKG